MQHPLTNGRGVTTGAELLLEAPSRNGFVRRVTAPPLPLQSRLSYTETVSARDLCINLKQESTRVILHRPLVFR